jgi:DNA-binding response OmpR family regulator
MATRVLVVEDEDDIAFPLVRALEREGYHLSSVATGRAALDHLAAEEVDLVLLDLGLPDMDGLDVCRAAREAGFDGGIMILTARSGELDLVVGLDHGADDYLAKPFGLAELQARVRALVRRSGEPRDSAPAAAASLRVDSASRRVHVHGVEVHLTTKEFDVLAALSERVGAVVTRDDLMAQVWDRNWYGSTKTLDVTIGRLRSKLDGAGASDRIAAVRGVGFRLEAPSSP